jgi:hypothetical protein
MNKIAIASALFFAFCAILQWNDPDPIRWFAFYAVAAIVAAASMFVPIPRPLFIAVACIAGAWAITLVPGIISVGSLTGTEEERELGGLLLVAASSVALSRSPTAGADS